MGVFNILGGDTPQQFNVLVSKGSGTGVPEPSSWSYVAVACLLLQPSRSQRRFARKFVHPFR